MPSSHGGGGSHVGSHGSFSSNNNSNINMPPRRFYYVGAIGRTCYMDSVGTPKHQNYFTAISSTIIGYLVLMSVIVVLLFSVLPIKLSSIFCKNTGSYVIDNEQCFDNTEEINNACKSFYEKTGIQIVIYTCNKDYTYSELENYAYDLYLDLFDDEGHWLLVYNYNSQLDWTWCDMAGDNTSGIITDSKFTDFKNSLQSKLENDSISNEYAFSSSINEISETIMNIDSKTKVGSIAIYLVGIAITIGAIYFGIKNVLQCKKNNEYCEYRDSNGGEDITDENNLKF